MGSEPRIVIAGAGAIGCAVGGCLLHAGHDVRFLGRAALGKSIATGGLRITGVGGLDLKVQPVVGTNARALSGADVVMVAVKSGATAQIAKEIAKHAPMATVVSLQNGLTNPDIMRAALPEADIRAAVVSFNVAQIGPAEFHCGTSGDIRIEGQDGYFASLTSPQMTFKEVHDIKAHQWGKLLMNLNNPLNALSGLPLREQLHDRNWRRILAGQMDEALNVLRRSDIRPAAFTVLPPRFVPAVLRLPTPIFRRVAKAMLTIDAQARSSMQDDLMARRQTEIDSIHGEVLRLAATHGCSCPMIQTVVDAIKKAEHAALGPPMVSPQEILQV